jgi:hypothetical protein
MKDQYFQNVEFPVLALKKYLHETHYDEMFQDLENIPMSCYDRYENPFEKKYTLHKKSFPTCVIKFLESFESQEFFQVLKSYYPEKKVCPDTHHHYWGVHKFGKDDFLAIHADAGIHPLANKPKFLTIGFYLNKEWNKNHKASLELWEGDSLRESSPEITKCFRKIETEGNTLVMFENTEYAWHGASEPYQGDLENNPRYFVTLSLLLDEDPSTHHNKRGRAYFAKVIGSVDSEELDSLRKKRSDNTQVAQVYRT